MAPNERNKTKTSKRVSNRLPLPAERSSSFPLSIEIKSFHNKKKTLIVYKNNYNYYCLNMINGEAGVDCIQGIVN